MKYILLKFLKISHWQIPFKIRTFNRKQVSNKSGFYQMTYSTFSLGQSINRKDVARRYSLWKFLNLYHTFT